MMTFNNRHQLLYKTFRDVYIHTITAKHLYYYKYIIRNIMVNRNAQVRIFNIVSIYSLNKLLRGNIKERLGFFFKREPKSTCVTVRL